jgi:hypothetical protein
MAEKKQTAEQVDFEEAQRAQTIQHSVAEPFRPLDSSTTAQTESKDFKKASEQQKQQKQQVSAVDKAAQTIRTALDQVAGVVRNAPQEERKSYRLVRGTHYVEAGRKLNVGDTAELTESQYRSLSDRFVPANEKEPQKDFEERMQSAKEPRPIPTTHRPQDAGGKTSIHLDEGVMLPVQSGVTPSSQFADGVSTQSRETERVRNEKTKA